MRKLIYNAGVSADGFIAGPDGEFDWLFSDQDYGIAEFMSEIDCTVMGRKSYEIIAMHDKDFFSTKENIVFTSSSSENTHGKVMFTNENPVDVVSELKKKEGKSIWLVGGGMLAGALLDAGLIDELLLSYHPVVLGKGIPLFRSGGGMHMFATTEVKNFSTGLVQVRYKLALIH
jgi:dihydrofolate reductase